MAETQHAASLPCSVGGHALSWVGHAEPLLDCTKRNVGHDREQGCGNGSSKNQLIVHHRDAAKNKFAETSCTDGRSYRRNSYCSHCCNANSGEHEGRAQRELHLREKLVACHSHSNRRFSYCGIDAHDPCVG